jgi:hypothetical protein
MAESSDAAPSGGAGGLFDWQPTKKPIAETKNVEILNLFMTDPPKRIVILYFFFVNERVGVQLGCPLSVQQNVRLAIK